MSKGPVHFILLLWLLFFTMACKKPAIVATKAPEEDVERFLVQEIDFKYLQAKAKIHFKDQDMDVNATANIRIKKDSIIWISLTPALGIEASRCLITKDSVFVIDRINNQFHKYDFNGLAEKINIKINYKMLEAMLLGNLPITKNPSDKLSRVPQGDYFLLHQKNDKTEVDNYVKIASMKLEMLEINEPETNKKLRINYTNFGNLSNTNNFAFNNLINLTYRVNTGIQSTSIAIEYNKVDLPEKDLNFPFNIPQKFNKKQD